MHTERPGTWQENNTTYTVSYLFEHDGCKVYRFYDMGHYVYFTTRGDVTAIKNDSTQHRTITIRKEPLEILTPRRRIP